jgi:hypothetical protein
MKSTICLKVLHIYRNRSKIWQLIVEFLFAGDGERDNTGAAEAADTGAAGPSGGTVADTAKPDISRFSFVRTRQSLAEIINAGKEPDVEMDEKGEKTLPHGDSGNPEKAHPDLDGTMESDGGSEKEYDERILDEDYCATDFSLLNLPKGKSLGCSKPATNS